MLTFRLNAVVVAGNFLIGLSYAGVFGCVFDYLSSLHIWCFFTCCVPSVLFVVVV